MLIVGITGRGKITTSLAHRQRPDDRQNLSCFTLGAVLDVVTVTRVRHGRRLTQVSHDNSRRENNCWISSPPPTVWCIANLSWGESYYDRRRKVIRERIRKEYDLPADWDDEIEEDGVEDHT